MRLINMKKLINILFCFFLLSLTSCKSNYLNEFYYIQDNVTNQEYKIGDDGAFDKISKDTNYELEDYVTYKLFRSKDDLNYYYFNNENRLYGFLTYDTNSSIFEWQIGTSNNDKFYEYIQSKDYADMYASVPYEGILKGEGLFLPDSKLDKDDFGMWINYYYNSKNCNENLFLGVFYGDCLHGFFIQYV